MTIEYMSWEERERLSDVLLANIKTNMAAVDALVERFNEEEADAVYRFYHQSFKVFSCTQPHIKAALELFERLAPEGIPINKWFAQIVQQALGQSFDGGRTNQNWTAETRPLLEAFYHCHMMLRMMSRYGRELEKSPQMLPAGWALVLYLYDLR